MVMGQELRLLFLVDLISAEIVSGLRLRDSHSPDTPESDYGSAPIVVTKPRQISYGGPLIAFYEHPAPSAPLELLGGCSRVWSS